MKTKQHLISVSEEVVQRLRTCSVYSPGDSYRKTIEKLLNLAGGKNE